MSFHVVNPQEEFDGLYDAMRQLLDHFYPLRTVTITSADPPYVTPTVKSMLRRRNVLTRAGNVEQAAAFTVKIGVAIKQHNSAELSRVDVLSDPHNMWSKVRQLTGRNKTGDDATQTPSSQLMVLNHHYAAISTDASYATPSVKSIVNNWHVNEHITEWQMFGILEKLRPTVSSLDGVPAWFLKISVQFFAASLADMFNLSLSSSVVPTHWKMASILPISKIPYSQTPADYRHISITPVESPGAHCRQRLYLPGTLVPTSASLTSLPSSQLVPPPTAALIQLFHIVTTLLDTNPYVIVYVLDFSKAFDSVRHTAVLNKYLQLKIPDNIYNWIESSFRDHSHCSAAPDLEVTYPDSSKSWPV